MNLINNFKYRPEIDGLRALAVLAVLFYHAGLGFPGGYVGVDIFFVISGFLITSLIIKEIEQDKFSFIQFYERRIRRIFPASAFLMLITLLGGWFLLLPSDFIGLGKTVISQAFFSSNIYFWRNTSYFGEAAELQPLLHMWSLAVEEQFYMIMPFFLWGLMKVIKIRSRAILIVIFAIVFFASLALSIWTLPKMQAFTFYLLPTRAWEMLLGSLVALIPALSLLKRPILREFLVLLGVLGMVLPCFLYTKYTLFPGLAALPPCLGTAFFIMGSSPQPNSALPFTAKIFTWRPIIFIGLISYSLYLWHWPLVAFSKYWALEEFTTVYKWGIVALSLIFGIASWRFIETPFRKKNIASGRKKLFLYAIATSVVFFISGSILIFNKGIVSRYSENILAYNNTKTDALHENRISKPLFLEDAKAGNFPVFGKTNTEDIDVLVWGDSHARSILPAVIKSAGNNYTVGSAWYSGTPPILYYIPSENFAEFTLYENSSLWAESIIEQVRIKEIPIVILAAHWSGYYNRAKLLESEKRDFAIESFNNNLLSTILALREIDVEVWLFEQVPSHSAAVPKALIKAEIYGTNISQYKCTKNQLAEQNKEFNAMKFKFESAGAKILDASELLLDSSGINYKMKDSDVVLYYDNHHLSNEGSKKLAEVFNPVFENLK